MTKRVFPVSDSQMRRDAKRNAGYTERMEALEKSLKSRYGNAYKRWPEDYASAKGETK